MNELMSFLAVSTRFKNIYDDALACGPRTLLVVSGGLSIPRNVVVDADELLGEKEKYKTISEDLDFTFTELAGF